MLPSPQFDGQPVAVQSEYCLNTRHKKAGCQRCAEVCPTGAITLQSHDHRSPRIPHLNAEQCVRCGLCLPHCPTDVFSQTDPPETRLAQTVSHLPDVPLALVCSQHPDPATTAAPVAAIVRHQRCLAAFSLSQLLDLNHNGQRDLWLDDTPCIECPIGQVQPLIVQMAVATNSLLEAFGHPSAVRTHLSQPEQLKPASSQVSLFEGGQPKFSRRGLFGALGQLTHQAADKATTTSSPPDSGPIPVSQRLPHHLPASRKHLIQQLTHLGEPVEEPLETAGLPFANVRVDGNACSACRLCARFCPTEALHFVAYANTFGLSFKAATCLDCGICAAACPEDAVSFGSQLPAKALVADKADWLVVGKLTPCARCGESTAIRDKEPGDQLLCFSCRQGGGPMQPLKDTAGLMADLLKKTL